MEKEFEVFKGHSDNKKIVTMSEIRKLMLSAGFMNALEGLGINEILFYNETMQEFKRIK